MVVREYSYGLEGGGGLNVAIAVIKLSFEAQFKKLEGHV